LTATTTAATSTAASLQACYTYFSFDRCIPMIIVLLQIVQSRKVELYSKHKLTATIVGNIQLQTWPIAFAFHCLCCWCCCILFQ